MHLSTAYSFFSNSAASTAEHRLRMSTTVSNSRGRVKHTAELCVGSIVFISDGSFYVWPGCVTFCSFPLRMGISIVSFSLTFQTIRWSFICIWSWDFTLLHCIDFLLPTLFTSASGRWAWTHSDTDLGHPPKARPSPSLKPQYGALASTSSLT